MTKSKPKKKSVESSSRGGSATAGTIARRSQRKPAVHKAGTRSFFDTSNRRFIILSLAVISALAFLIRSLHLFAGEHHYIVSVDSHVFHWMARLIMEGEPLPAGLPTGLSYPMAYIAKTLSFVLPLSDAQALAFTAKFLPPFLAVVFIVVLYAGVSKMYDRRTGLGASFAWAVLPHAYFIQAAGYLDRDPLNVILMVGGILAYYVSKDWKVQIKGREVGWILGPAVFVMAELFLYLEWSWMGPALMLAILACYYVVEVVARYWEGANVPKSQYAAAPFSFRTRMKAALRASRWKQVLLILGISILAFLINFGATGDILRVLRAVFAPGGGFIAELGGLTAGDLLLFQFFLLLIPIGIFLALIRHHDADLLVVTWFIVLFGLSFYSRRVVLYAIPAGAILAGLVISNLFDFAQSRKLERKVQMIVTIIVVGTLLGFASTARGMGNEARVSANASWTSALSWLNENSSEDAVVMSWWDYGYWILDLADRKPVVDGGLYGHSHEQDVDIGSAYCGTDHSKAVEIMSKYNADYLIFSEIEGREIWAAISWYANPQVDPRISYQTSFYYKVMSEQFQSAGRLSRVYPDASVTDPGVVILALQD